VQAANPSFVGSLAITFKGCSRPWLGPSLKAGKAAILPLFADLCDKKGDGLAAAVLADKIARPQGGLQGDRTP
jgi:hypothetical protein